MRHARAFDQIAAYSSNSATLAQPGAAPRELRALRVTSSFFAALNLAVDTGRPFAADDDVPNGPAVCILSYETWQSAFGGRPVVGTSVRIDGHSTEIVGVLPPHLSAPWSDREILLPRPFEDPQLPAPSVAAGAMYLNVVARMAHGITAAQAADDIRGVSRAFAAAYPGRSDAAGDLRVQPLVDSVAGNRRGALRLLIGAVALVLLIACANASALFVSRIVSRQLEFSIRRALGAGRLRIALAVAADGFSVAIAAGVLGFALSAAALGVIGAVLGGDLPAGTTLHLGRPALTAGAAAVVCTAALVSLVPVVHVLRLPLGSAEGWLAGRSSETAGTRRLRAALAAGEVALATFLLVGAALFVASLVRLQHLPLGFDPSGVVTASVALPGDRYDTPERQAAFFAGVLERVRQDPRVTHAAVVFGLPFDDNFASRYVVEGRPIPPAPDRPVAGLRIVTEDYFAVMRMRLVAGRTFAGADRAGGHGVCIVNESLAKRQFGAESPLGRTLRRGLHVEQAYEIVGVVADVKTNGPRNDPPDEIFFPFAQLPRPAGVVVIRTGADAAALRPLVESAVAQFDGDLPLERFATMEERLAGTLNTERITAALTSAFAVLALLLAATGLYAVLAHQVAARTTEFGIRMALGADRRTIMRLTLADGLRPVAWGIACGLAGAWAASRVVGTELYGVSARDPRIGAGVALAFAAVGVAAAWLPARRAACVDPAALLAGR
jgi:predicted permease